MRYRISVPIEVDVLDLSAGTLEDMSKTLRKRLTCEVDAEGPQEARAEAMSGLFELADHEWPTRTRLHIGEVSVEALPATT